MKETDALVWLGPRKIELQRVPIPEPADGELLLSIRAAGICGSEVSGYLGHNSLRKPPLVMGHEAAGTVAEIRGRALADGSAPRRGSLVTFNPLVTCGACDMCLAARENLCRKRALFSAHLPGAFTGFLAVPAKNCYPLPDGLTKVQGALVEPLSCGVRAARLGGVAAGQSVLILGAGFIGLCCLAAAKEAGAAEIIVADLSETRLGVAAAWGATRTVGASKEDVRAAVARVRPGGVQVAIDAVGTVSTRETAVRSVVPGGRVVFIGLHEEESILPSNYVVRQEISITGSFAYTSADFVRGIRLARDAGRTLSGDWLQLRPLSEGPQAFAELADGRSAATKVVLQIG